MSIIGLIGELRPSLEVWIAVLSIAATLVALGIFIKSRAWRPESIRGPQRLESDEPLAPLLFILLGGVSLWLFVPALILKLRHPGVAMDAIKPTQAETVVLGIVGGAVPLLFMLLGTLTRRRRGFETLGFDLRHLREAFAPALAGTVFILPLVGWVAIISDWMMRKYHIQHPMKHELLEIMDQSPGPLLKVLIAFGAVMVAPLFEEFLFRGHLQTLLARVSQRPWVAVAVTSLMFALVHHWSIWLPIFTLSLCLGYMYERTGNLWVTVLMHAMFNGFSIVINLGSH